MTHLGLNSVALPRGGDEIVRIGWKMYSFRERCIIKKSKKKLTSVSFMYVCVAENADL